MMAHVDLCSGIGGFALGFEWAGLSKPVLFCDIEPWSRKILKKHWPDVLICEDVKELADDPDRYVPRLDWSNTIVSGGYPCQAFSVAGRQKGWEDPRAIWPWLFKLVALKRPKFCVFENVTGHIALGLDKVIHDLEGENYSVTTLIIPASAVGAPHKRERLWIIAHSNSNSQSDVTKHEQERLVADTESSKRWPRQEPKQQKGDAPRQSISNGSSNVADTNNTRNRASKHETEQDRQTADEGRQEQPQSEFSRQRNNVADTESRVGKALNERCLLEQSHTEGQTNRHSDGSLQARAIGQPQPRMGDLADGLSTGMDRFGKHDGFEVEPSDIPRVASGIKDRANRLKGLGNAIVPGIAMQIGLAIKESQWK